jgi:hypothetical protein
MQHEVAREEAKDRRTFARVQIAASVVLLASTLFAWENHPRVEGRAVDATSYFVREVSHTIGLVTVAAGPLVIALGALALVFATRLRRVRLPYGWLALGLSLGALAVCTVEITQGILGRKDWLDHLSSAVAQSGSAGGVGVGVWLAGIASLALVANASTYLWLGYRLWRNNPAVTDETS